MGVSMSKCYKLRMPPLKPTRPGLGPPSRIAKGCNASVQRPYCCEESGFKSAFAPFLNTHKTVALLVRRDI